MNVRSLLQILSWNSFLFLPVIPLATSKLIFAVLSMIYNILFTNLSLQQLRSFVY